MNCMKPLPPTPLMLQFPRTFKWKDPTLCKRFAKVLADDGSSDAASTAPTPMTTKTKEVEMEVDEEDEVEEEGQEEEDSESSSSSSS